MWKGQSETKTLTSFEHTGIVKSKKLDHPCHIEKKLTFFHSKLQIKDKSFKEFRESFLRK